MIQQYQQRVIDEKTELDEKLTKLIGFFDTSIYKNLPEDEQRRLREQSEHMSNYSAVLGARISAS